MAETTQLEEGALKELERLKDKEKREQAIEERIALCEVQIAELMEKKSDLDAESRKLGKEIEDKEGAKDGFVRQLRNATRGIYEGLFPEVPPEPLLPGRKKRGKKGGGVAKADAKMPEHDAESPETYGLSRDEIVAAYHPHLLTITDGKVPVLSAVVFPKDLGGEYIKLDDDVGTQFGTPYIAIPAPAGAPRAQFRMIPLHPDDWKHNGDDEDPYTGLRVIHHGVQYRLGKEAERFPVMMPTAEGEAAPAGTFAPGAPGTEGTNGAVSELGVPNVEPRKRLPDAGDVPEPTDDAAVGRYGDTGTATEFEDDKGEAREELDPLPKKAKPKKKAAAKPKAAAKKKPKRGELPGRKARR